MGLNESLKDESQPFIQTSHGPVSASSFLELIGILAKVQVSAMSGKTAVGATQPGGIILVDHNLQVVNTAH